MEYGFTSLEPKTLEQLEGNDWEEFCEELLRFERDARHPGALVAGTAPASTGDAGKDLRLTTSAAPTKAKAFFPNAITEDEIGETYFSCKGGSGWEVAVLDDMQRQSAPLDVLAAGGHFSILINRKADLKKKTQAFANAGSGKKASRKKKNATTTKVARTPAKGKPVATFEEGLVGALLRRLQTERSIVASDLGSRVHVYDASQIAAFLKTHRPSLSHRFAVKLGIRRLEYLRSLDEWERELTQRQFPRYAPDPSRTSAIATVGAVVTSTAASARDRTLWVHGAPGVGKSRMVLEALRKHPRLVDFEHRILVAGSDADASDAINAGVTQHSSDVILVVDECAAERVSDLSGRFLSRSSSGTSALVMIGPRPRPGQTSPVPDLPVDPLDEDACRALVVSTLGIEPGGEQPLVERVLYLCEGYPWSAVLIAQALREDRNALPLAATHWHACELTLVGKPSVDLAGWHSEALRRARAVLAVMLTDGIDWHSVDEPTMNRVAHAVGLASATDLLSAAEECDNRGLLRRRLDWKYKYVTPNNVARQVAMHLLSSPHRVARSIRHHCPELVSSLHEQLGGLDVPPSILGTLADDELQALEEEPPTLSGVARGDPSGATLEFLGTHRPARTAGLLRGVVENATTVEWRGNAQARFVLGSVLGSLARRRDGFDDSERGLYRLAVEERRLGAAQAVNSWRSLFLVHLNPTYLPFPERLARLTARLPDADPTAKQVVVRGLEVPVSEHESRFGGDPVDGPWLRPTQAEARDAMIASWRTLFNLVGDPDPEVGFAVRSAIIKHLRAAVRTGVGATALELMLEALPLWPSDECLRVRETLDQVAQYDVARLDDKGKELHKQLLEALRPRSFHERLVDAVGRWRSWQGKASFKDSEAFVAARDEELALEGLQGDAALKDELDWLGGPDAQRSVLFMAAVGRVDGASVLLPVLERRIGTGRYADLMSAYLSGLAATGREGEVDALLRRWRSLPVFALPTFLTVWRVGPTDERISWLVDDVESKYLPPDTFRMLMLGSWGAKANTAPLRALACALIRTNETAAFATALTLVLAKTDAVPESSTELFDVLGDVVLRLATVPDPDTMIAYEWELACAKLAAGGRNAVVIAAAMEALRTSESVGFADRVWTVLHPLLETQALAIWTALTQLLEDANDVGRILVDARASGLLRHVPVEVVINWIGTNRDRQFAVAEMCSAHEAPLNPLAHGLIAKYGAQSPAASVIAAQAHSTPSVVTSLADFARTQLANARVWARDSDAEVAKWGARMVQEIEHSAEEFDAREEYEKRKRRQ